MANLNIGLSLSGGGYRAATFHLGTLSFLNSISVSDGKTLLDCVSVMSTVSGGSITGLRYMLALAKKEDINAMVEDLFNFLYNENLVDDAFSNIEKGQTDNGTSLIKIMASIYDDKLYNHAVMGDLMDCINDIPVKHFSANATDFDNGLPFRFQVTETRMTEDKRSSFGIFGNNSHRVGGDIARCVTLGEALACSSCFPSGFEPMMFPDDFNVCKNENAAKIDSFGIMDGGIVDNQGIEPILLAEERLRKCEKDRTDKALELVIVSDVTSPYLNGYSPHKHWLPTSIREWTISKMKKYALFAEIIISLLLIAALFVNNHYVTGAMAVVWGIVTLAIVAFYLINNKILKLVSKTVVGKNASYFNHLSFADIEALLMNRANSILMMSSSVFLKAIRKMNYATLYDDDDWENRTISNTIYELRDGEKWKSRSKNGTLSDFLNPSEAMQENSTKAANMGTTLWFTESDKEKGVPEAILAAGQYTICYNLLDYIDKIQENSENLNENHQLIIACKQKLQDAWTKFQGDPLWMTSKLTSSLRCGHSDSVASNNSHINPNN